MFSIPDLCFITGRIGLIKSMVLNLDDFTPLLPPRGHFGLSPKKEGEKVKFQRAPEFDYF
jgi:hypothetical protein